MKDIFLFLRGWRRSLVGEIRKENGRAHVLRIEPPIGVVGTACCIQAYRFLTRWDRPNGFAAGHQNKKLYRAPRRGRGHQSKTVMASLIARIHCLAVVKTT